MIKLLQVFDKAAGNVLSGGKSRDHIRELILDEISSIDIHQAICPICGSKNVSWNYRRCKIQSIIWDNPDVPIEVALPQYFFQCMNCDAKGTDLITTDLTIDKTNLSYHYLFHLIRFKLMTARRAVPDPFYLDNLLYGLLCEESLKKWLKRFQADCAVLSRLMEIDSEAILYEQVMMSEIFLKFYLAEGRFFLSEARPKMLLYADSQGNLHCVRRTLNDTSL